MKEVREQAMHISEGSTFQKGNSSCKRRCRERATCVRNSEEASVAGTGGLSGVVKEW